MVKQIEGCTHIIFKNGKIVNIFTHLNKLPRNGVIHLKGDKMYNIEEFKESHPRDYHKLKKHKKNYKYRKILI